MDKKYCDLYNSENYDLDNFNNIDTDDEDNCVNCFHSDGVYCYCKNIYINKLSPICWCYRDCFSMRTNSDFQDDNDDFNDEDFEKYF